LEILKLPKNGPPASRNRQGFLATRLTGPQTPFRAGLHARVSTQDQQTIPLQTRVLREYAARRDWTIALQVREIGSGSSQRVRREQLLEAALRREIDIVLVWRLDRWGRSVADLLATLDAARGPFCRRTEV
jgi:predicted site-specific integrase-resolvase